MSAPVKECFPINGTSDTGYTEVHSMRVDGEEMKAHEIPGLFIKSIFLMRYQIPKTDTKSEKFIAIFKVASYANVLWVEERVTSPKNVSVDGYH